MHGTDAVRIPGLASDISQQIAKYDSSEFDDDKEVQGGDAEGVWAPEIEQSFQGSKCRQSSLSHLCPFQQCNFGIYIMC